jgi:hypothetical protein
MVNCSGLTRAGGTAAPAPYPGNSPGKPKWVNVTIP